MAKDMRKENKVNNKDKKKGDGDKKTTLEQMLDSSVKRTDTAVTGDGTSLDDDMLSVIKRRRLNAEERKQKEAEEKLL